MFWCRPKLFRSDLRKEWATFEVHTTHIWSSVRLRERWDGNCVCSDLLYCGLGNMMRVCRDRNVLNGGRRGVGQCGYFLSIDNNVGRYRISSASSQETLIPIASWDTFFLLTVTLAAWMLSNSTAKEDSFDISFLESAVCTKISLLSE